MGVFLLKPITIKEIARMANVSCATVSRTLNGGPGVSQELRGRIFQLCRQHGYRKNLVARRLSASHSGLIGCILSDMNNPLFAEFALALEKAAHCLGLQVMFCQSQVENPNFSRTLELLIGHRVDGVILASSSRQVQEAIRPYADRIPMVIQGTLSPDVTGIPAVSVDCAKAGREVARYFYQLGHRRAAFLGLRENNSAMCQRYRGFSEMAAELGISVRAVVNPEQRSTTNVGYQLGRSLLFDGMRETAIFAGSDNVALGFLAAAREFCVSVPEEVSLVGFDNISHAAMHHVRLTTFDPGNQVLAEQSLQRLLRCLEPGGEGQGTLLIPPVFVERNTCAPPARTRQEA